MKLSTKIFVAISVSIFSLLGGVLYTIGKQAENQELLRLSEELEIAQIRFQLKLEEHQKYILKLVKTITMDQKFRSFLSQIKENFYSFTEEIALDSNGDIVFMVDDIPQQRGIYPSTEASHLWINKNLHSFRVMDVIENGQSTFQIISLDHELFSVVYIPLKEILSDDYAVGVIVVCNKIDDRWVKWLLGPGKKSSSFQVVFFSENRPVAQNISPPKSALILNAAAGLKNKTGSFLLSKERYIARRGIFNTDGETAGYIFCSNLDQALEPFRALKKKILLIGLFIFSIGLIVSRVFSKNIVRPLLLVVSGTREVLKGNYDFRIHHKFTGEVGELAKAFNHMLEGLKEKDLVRSTFNKYVNPSIVSEILANPDKLKLGGHRQIQTILFSDIVNFTSISEKMSPDSLINFLNEYFGVMNGELSRYNGILDKYLGDGIMAFFGPPFCKVNHALDACCTAINMQKKLSFLRANWLTERKPGIHVRIGLATGEMVVGNIGSEQAQDYTCIGDTVNYSSRLESLNKFYGTKIIIDENTKKQACQIVTRKLDLVQVKGREQGSSVFELLGLEDEIGPEKRQMVQNYEVALYYYLNGEFEVAEKNFKEILRKSSNDTPSRVMLKRCQFYIANPPVAWEGVHTMKEK